MGIHRIEIERHAAALSRSVGNARTTYAAREGLLLRVVDDSGYIGIGEASPLPGYSSDTVALAEDELARLVPADLTSFSASSLFDPGTSPIVELRRRSPSAAFAVETALLDCEARRAGVPVHRLFRTTDPPSVPLAKILPATSEDDALEVARRAHEAGTRTFKLKIGRDLEGELLLSARIRERWPSVALRLDANGSLPKADAPEVLRRFAAYDIAFVEEPVPLDDLFTLPPLPIPVALDESLRRPDAERLLVRAALEQRCTAVVLKPMALGGFSPCIAWATTARSLGLNVVVTHLFDGPIALAAAAELALVLSPTLAAGLAPHEGLSAWPEAKICALGEACLAAHASPGLGLSWNR